MEKYIPVRQEAQKCSTLSSGRLAETHHDLGRRHGAHLLSVPSLRVGWLKTAVDGALETIEQSFSTLSSGRLAENDTGCDQLMRLHKLSVPSLRVGWLKTTGLNRKSVSSSRFQYPLFGSVG